MKFNYLSILLILSSYSLIFNPLNIYSKKDIFSESEEKRLEDIMNRFLNNELDDKPFDQYVEEIVSFLGKKKEFKKFCKEFKTKCKTKNPNPMLIGLCLYKAKNLFPKYMREKLEGHSKDKLLQLLQKRLENRSK
jgi:hypothetical protein